MKMQIINFYICVNRTLSRANSGRVQIAFAFVLYEIS